MRQKIITGCCNRLWLLYLQLWLHTQYAWCIRLAQRIAPRVTYFPDRWYTQRVSLLDVFGLTQQQIGAIWEINGTWNESPKVKPEETP